MRLAGKTACFLLFLFIFIAPLYAETSDDDEVPVDEKMFVHEELEESGDLLVLPSDDEEYFFEEFFIFEGVLSFKDSLMDDFIDEDVFSDEPHLSEETFSEEEILLSEETFSGEENIPDEGDLLAEEDFPAEDEDDLFDVESLFFEAPSLVFEAPILETRSLDEIFPDFSEDEKEEIEDGLRHYFAKDEDPTFVPNPELGIDLLGTVMKKNPSHLIEALVLVPYEKKEFDLLDIYNALGRIEKIQERTVTSRGRELYVFPETTRIISSRNRKAIPDPAPAITLPFSETIYLRLKDFYFGNLFLRADVSLSMYGITYSMTNFTDVRYFLIPIMKAERFITIIYLEPLKEGILIYSVTGFYVPGFIADRVNLTPDINRRIRIFIDWITEGLESQESAAME